MKPYTNTEEFWLDKKAQLKVLEQEPSLESHALPKALPKGFFLGPMQHLPINKNFQSMLIDTTSFTDGAGYKFDTFAPEKHNTAGKRARNLRNKNTKDKL